MSELPHLSFYREPGEYAPIPSVAYDERSQALMEAVTSKGYFTHEIADGVHYVTEGWYFMLVVVHDDGLAVVDAPPTIGQDFVGGNILNGIAEISDKPVTHLVYSHHHRDHIGAANVFPEDVTIIAQTECAHMVETAMDPQPPSHLTSACPTDMTTPGGGQEDDDTGAPLMAIAHALIVAERDPARRGHLLAVAGRALDAIRRRSGRWVRVVVGREGSAAFDRHQARTLVDVVAPVEKVFEDQHAEDDLRGRPEDYRGVFEFPITGPRPDTYSDPSIAGGGQGVTQVTHPMGMVFWVTGLRAEVVFAEMDGFDTQEGIILMAATNRPDVLDPALLRPGRFDRRVIVNRPDVKGRLEILQVHVQDRRLASDVNLMDIAKSTPGLVGADLASVVNEAAILAVRNGHVEISVQDFQEAVEKNLIGSVQQKSRVMSATERRTIAYHEAGHAVVMHCTEHADPVYKITIIPRGQMGGFTMSLPEQDSLLMSRNQILARITGLMGGRVAEELFCDDITSGAGHDLKIATQLAEEMVMRLGMSETGLRVFNKPV